MNDPILSTPLFAALLTLALLGVPGVQFTVAYLKGLVPDSLLGGNRTRALALVVGLAYAGLALYVGLLSAPQLEPYPPFVRVIVLGLMLAVLAGGRHDTKK